MFTPFEELEYLAEFLPEEGETVLVTRRQGELVCEPYRQETKTSAFSDAAFYGRLIQATERLTAAATFPIWSTILLTFWACVAVHKLAGIGWEGWYLDAGLTLIATVGATVWIRLRQSRLFQKEIRPMLIWQFRKNGLDAYAFLGEIRRRRELRPLTSELWRWIDD